MNIRFSYGLWVSDWVVMCCIFKTMGVRRNYIPTLQLHNLVFELSFEVCIGLHCAPGFSNIARADRSMPYPREELRSERAVCCIVLDLLIWTKSTMENLCQYVTVARLCRIYVNSCLSMFSIDIVRKLYASPYLLVYNGWCRVLRTSPDLIKRTMRQHSWLLIDVLQHVE